MYYDTEHSDLAKEMIAAVRKLQEQARAVKTGLSTDIKIFHDFANLLDVAVHDSSLECVEPQELSGGEAYDSDEARMKFATMEVRRTMHQTYGSAS